MNQVTQNSMQQDEHNILSACPSPGTGVCDYPNTTPAPLSAAEQFRLLQAIELIQSFRETIVVDGKEIDVPVFIPSDSDPEAFELNPILEQRKNQDEKSNEEKKLEVKNDLR